MFTPSRMLAFTPIPGHLGNVYPIERETVVHIFES
jgi:hypothetical protein